MSVCIHICSGEGNSMRYGATRELHHPAPMSCRTNGFAHTRTRTQRTAHKTNEHLEPDAGCFKHLWPLKIANKGFLLHIAPKICLQSMRQSWRERNREKERVKSIKKGDKDREREKNTKTMKERNIGESRPVCKLKANIFFYPKSTPIGHNIALEHLWYFWPDWSTSAYSLHKHIL